MREHGVIAPFRFRLDNELSYSHLETQASSPVSSSISQESIIDYRTHVTAVVADHFPLCNAYVYVAA